MPKAILKEMGIFKAQLGDQTEVGLGVKGYRLVSDVVSAELISEHINASLATNDAADWLTLSEDKKTGALDVRLTLKTDDDAYIYVEYSGRADMESNLIAAAPTFQTGSKKYDWLNKIQVVAAGEIDTNAALTYTLYEVIVSSSD